MREHEAAEKVRQEQQGHGRPIVSWESNGTRFVAVKNHVWYPPKGRTWVYFADFLFDYLKSTLKHEWGARAQRVGLPHPLFRWQEKLNRYQQQTSGAHGRPMVGFVSGILHLAYALYQIAHNDVIPNKLLRRLREPLNFLPAFYELIVGASLAIAGMEIENAEKKASGAAAPEFRAKSKHNGKVYDVEAKRKASWSAATADLQGEEFKSELSGYIRDQIYKAAKKKLTNPILWIELSVPDVHGEADWRALMHHVNDVMADAQAMTVDGEPIGPTFVIVTNHTFLSNEDVVGEPFFAALHSINVSDFCLGRTADLEDLLESYDKYRDVFAMMEGWRIARAIPPSFDGTPGEFLNADGTVTRPIKIGDRVIVSGPTGEEVVVVVDELASSGDKITVAVRDEIRNITWMYEMPLSKAEAQAASRYTDAVFGKSNVSRKLRQDDPFDLYDWILNAYSRTTPEQLAKLMLEPLWEPYRDLPTEQKRRRFARQYTKAIWMRSHPEKPATES
jgi:hypothetical protein